MTTTTRSAVNARHVIRRLADDVSMVVWEADADDCCTYLNPAAREGLSSPCEVNISD